MRWAVYRFAPGEQVDLTRSDALLGVTYSREWQLDGRGGVYVVTSLSRVGQESAPSAPLTVSL